LFFGGGFWWLAWLFFSLVLVVFLGWFSGAFWLSLHFLVSGWFWSVFRLYILGFYRLNFGLFISLNNQILAATQQLFSGAFFILAKQERGLFFVPISARLVFLIRLVFGCSVGLLGSVLSASDFWGFLLLIA